MQAILAKTVPDRLRDRLLTRIMGLPGPTAAPTTTFSPKILLGLAAGLIVGRLLLRRRQ